jgi:hypothetical protein
MSLKPYTKRRILDYIRTNPIELTYFAIGSANNKDQQLPPFILDYNVNTRIIVIDPCLESELRFVVESKLPFVSSTINDIKIYKHGKYEFLCIKDCFHYKNDLMFAKDMVDTIIYNGGTLLGYNYSGNCMFQLQQQLYDNFYDNTDYRQLFLDHILFDFTYGQFELSCFVDFTNKNQQPDIVIEDGNLKIINICCYHLNKNIEKIIDTIISSKINLSNQIRIYLKNIIYRFNNELYVKFRKYRDSDDITEYNQIATLIKDIYKNIAIMLNIDFDPNEFLKNLQNTDKYSCFDDINKIISCKFDLLV